MEEQLKNIDSDLVLAKINNETARIPWHDLQRFFAAGKTLYITAGLDLVEVAYAFHEDHSEQVNGWIKQEKIIAVSTVQAKDWIENESQVWAVVVKPWVLVQDCD
ncbi:MAG: DUF2288 domain-containing protein [Gammaproteobacteria bacterium]|nr:DUF2288 domain-containing protein [Gammaproteobacteria bacterium]